MIFGSFGTVRNGLIWAIDAGDSLSYPGSGSTWTDVIGGNNVTLTGSPTYNSLPPSLTFGGTPKGSTANAAGLQINTGTVIVWAKPTSGNTGFRGLATKENAYGIFVYNNKLAIYDWGNQSLRDSGVTVGNGTWQMLTLTFSAIGTGTPSNNAILYRNEVAAMTTTLKLNNQATTGIWVAANNSNQVYLGDISSAFLYSRVLEASEVVHHYNGTKSRFGL